MKYDTSPLSIDTLDVAPNPSDDPLRFVPDDQDIHQTNESSEFDSGSISPPTIDPRQIEIPVGFETFIENRPETDTLKGFAADPTRPKYRSWAMVGLLVVFSAFAGGTAVYFFASPTNTTSVQQQAPAANTAVTDVQPSDTFVIKTPNETAAEEPLVPHSPEVASEPARPVYLGKTREDQPASDANIQLPASDQTTETAPTLGQAPTPTEPEPQLKQPEREAKVGAYVVEKPASGRKPLARCADGTYSFSASKSAACSGRGGVGEWMTDGRPASNTPAKQAAYVLGPRGGCYYLDSSNKKIYVEKKFCQ